MRTISFIKNYNNNHILVHKMKTDCIQCHLLDHILLICVGPFLVGIKQFRRKKTRYYQQCTPGKVRWDDHV